MLCRVFCQEHADRDGCGLADAGQRVPGNKGRSRVLREEGPVRTHRRMLG